MNSDCYFEECKICIDRHHNNKLSYCLANRLSLALHKLFIELSIIRRICKDECYCKAFEEDKYV